MVGSTGTNALAASLESLDDAHNYRAWIQTLAAPFLDPPVLEVGAGTGTFTLLLAEVGSVVAVEPSGSLAGALRARCGSDARVEVVEGVVEDVDAAARFGSAVMFNVLEHVPDDAKVLRQIHDRLLPGAHLVLWVPAFPLLYSRFDEMLGHHRRYRSRPLAALVEQSGYSVTNVQYVNVIGWFAWLVVARLLGRVPTSTRLVTMYDRWVVPVMRQLESVMRPPLGQSIFLVARKRLAAPA